MSQQPPQSYESESLSEDDRRLLAIFAEIETKQLEFLDNAGKSIVERVAALLAVLFAVTAFGDSFPPPYLKDTAIKGLALGTLLFYLAAMFVAMRAVQPRPYDLYRHNLTGMRAELRRMIENKSRSVRIAGVLFWLGSLMLTLLVGWLVLTA